MQSFEVAYSVGNRDNGIYETRTCDHFRVIVQAQNHDAASRMVQAQNGGSNRCQIDWCKAV